MPCYSDRCVRRIGDIQPEADVGFYQPMQRANVRQPIRRFLIPLKGGREPWKSTVTLQCRKRTKTENVSDKADAQDGSSPFKSAGLRMLEAYHLKGT